MEPNNADFLMNKASILHGAKRLKEAIETCRTTLEQNPNHGDGWVTLESLLGTLWSNVRRHQRTAEGA